jgi:tetratricopeptide (TPR) repeat protein
MRVYLKNIYFIFVFSLYLLFPKLSISQEIIGNEPLAIEYFNEKNYEKALPIFTQLINKVPGNAMYNYYYGVSLLKNNCYETATKESLLNAVVDKTPSNANFYLGNYFHALENWPEAIDFYKRYNGSKHERQELEYDKFYSLCLKHINPFKVERKEGKTVFQDTVKVPALMPDEKNFPVPDSLKTEWFNFQVNSLLTYHSITDFRSEAAKILFTKAWIATGKNDSIVKNTDVLRKAHQETHDVTTRIALVQRIIDAEQQSYQFLRDREKYFEQARVKESSYWENAGPEAMAKFIDLITEKEKNRSEQLQNATMKVEIVPVEVPDTIIVRNNPEPEEQPTTENIQSPGQTNVIFKVQIGSYPNGKLTPAFKSRYAKLSKFRKIDKYTDSKKNVIYTIGNFTDYRDATLLKNQLILEGVKGAFLAAFKNGERIPVTSVVKEKPLEKPVIKEKSFKKPVVKDRPSKKPVVKKY